MAMGNGGGLVAAPSRAHRQAAGIGSKHHPTTEDSLRLLSAYEKQLAGWNWQVNALRSIQVLFALIVVVATALLTFVAGNDDALRRTLEATVAIAAAVLTGFGIGPKADRWRNAWRHLKVAVTLRGVGDLSDRELIVAYRAAEAMIGGVALSVQTDAVGKVASPSEVNAASSAKSDSDEFRAAAAPASLSEAKTPKNNNLVRALPGQATADGSFKK